MTDPSSHVAAAIAGWSHAMSRESLVMANLYDAFVKVHTKAGHKPTPYPRPWDEREKRFGRTTLPQAQVRAALRARGHHI